MRMCCLQSPSPIPCNINDGILNLHFQKMRLYAERERGEGVAWFQASERIVVYHKYFIAIPVTGLLSVTRLGSETSLFHEYTSHPTHPRKTANISHIIHACIPLWPILRFGQSLARTLMDLLLKWRSWNYK